jgi:gliding motility-associated-like protein
LSAATFRNIIYRYVFTISNDRSLMTDKEFSSFKALTERITMGKRRHLLFLIAMCLCQSAFGQKPTVLKVDKSQAASGEVLAVQGNDFGIDPARMRVFFGAAPARIKSIANQLMEVETPAGTSFDNISVTNINSGLTGYSPEKFFLNYRGEAGISITEFSTQTDFNAQSGLYDLCLCDFNSDNKVDVATASSSSNLITLFQNASTPGNISLTPSDFLINAHTLHTKCGDLNGDGKPDIVLSEGSDGDRIFILMNNGAFNFTMQNIRLTGRKVKRVAIADLDLDGKPEIVVTDTGGNILSILRNNSSLTAIAFDAPLSLPIPQALSTDALEVADLNGDGLPEIITSQYQADSENKLFICRNGGGLNFNDISILNVNKAVTNIRAGDFDGDNKPDIAIARLTGSDVSLYRNVSATGIAFSAPSFFITDVRPVGVDFGDFDGDGKMDVAVGSLAKSVSILNNTSVPGTTSAATAVKLPTTYINRNLRNADMDGDGKPDIVFTSVDDFSGDPQIPASKVSIIRNTACMVPVVTPGGPLEICIGYPLRLRATAGGGVTYQWFKDGSPTPVKSGSESFFDVLLAGNYKATATAESGACVRTSNIVAVSVSDPGAGLNATAPDAHSNSPVCIGNPLDLAVNDVGASEYRWRGPDNFSQTTSTETVSMPGFTSANAGVYFVDMISGTCIARTDSTVVEAVTIPEFNVSYSGAPAFCSGSSKLLSVAPLLTSGFTYQWFEKTAGIIPEATSATYEAMTSGEYRLQVFSDYPGCADKETGSVVVTGLLPPTADFQAPAQGCVGSAVPFTQLATGDPLSTKIYNWNFGDGHTGTGPTSSNAFTSANGFSVSLTVTYDGVSQCAATIAKNISIIAPLVPEILSTALEMCEGESTTLSVNGAFATITWSGGGSGASTDVHAAGNYTVSTVDNNGCASLDEIAIAQKDIPELVVFADPPAIAAGQKVQLQAEGADAYSWSPANSLNDATLANPVAMPTVTTTYTVTGELVGGCSAQTSITIEVNGEIISVVVPALLSPNNGDDINQYWVIAGVENYPDCALNVFDRHGRRVFETLGYQNNWDGTVKGNPLPEGVYYYVFGCPNKKVLTGTVTVIR